MKIPIISVTDLYHPHQDPGDNFDLISAFALPEIDLKGVVLDCTEPFRQPVAGPLPSPALYPVDDGPRDPGVIPVCQLNYIFDRNVPYGIGPFRQMDSSEDTMCDAPAFQQTGIELILNTLRASNDPVHIMSFGSARTIAAAYNRDPRLFIETGAVIELSAGASSGDFMEWNTALDPHAVVCLLRSSAQVNIYPDATAAGPFDTGEHNTYYHLPDIEFIERMDARLRRYLRYAFGRCSHMDFLRRMDFDWECAEAATRFRQPHKVWETALWMRVSGRVAARRDQADRWRILPRADVDASWEILDEGLTSCLVDVADDGIYTIDFLASGSSKGKKRQIYYRRDPAAYQAAMPEALPELYRSYLCGGCASQAFSDNPAPCGA